jgi:predicted dehydrogenase
MSAAIHVGRHLPSVRPGHDYRRRPAAQRAKGGGVLRELSHELDYALWLFGPWRRVTALGGVSGALESDADDRWSILIEAERCAQIGVGLSFIDRARRRQIHVEAADASATVDLDAQTFASSDLDAPERIAVEREASYRAQHAAIVSGDAQQACTFGEGVAVLRLIAAIERASAERCWVSSSG